jgi:hypothetical protein
MKNSGLWTFYHGRRYREMFNMLGVGFHSVAAPGSEKVTALKSLLIRSVKAQRWEVWFPIFVAASRGLSL